MNFRRNSAFWNFQFDILFPKIGFSKTTNISNFNQKPFSSVALQIIYYLFYKWNRVHPPTLSGMQCFTAMH